MPTPQYFGEAIPSATLAAIAASTAFPPLARMLGTAAANGSIAHTVTDGAKRWLRSLQNVS